jgi:hypothetical protein
MSYEPETRPVIRRRTCLAIPLPTSAHASISAYRLRNRWHDTLGGALPGEPGMAALEAECRRREGRDWEREMADVRDLLCPEILP